MRVLILSAFLACAAAAPFTVVTPLVYQPQVISAVVPTISPGDVQAAAIDTQVNINDQAQAITDQAIENVDKQSQTQDMANERNVEAFWSNEDNKWQAFDALKTAEAEIDGAVASNADAYAKTAVSGVVPYVAASAPVVVGAISSPVVYNSYLPVVNTISSQTMEKAETSKEQKQEDANKNKKPEKPAEPVEKMEAVEKSADKPIVLASTIVTPYSGVLNWGSPVLNNFIAPPIVNYASIQPALTSRYVSWW